MSSSVLVIYSEFVGEFTGTFSAIIAPKPLFYARENTQCTHAEAGNVIEPVWPLLLSSDLVVFYLSSRTKLTPVEPLSDFHKPLTFPLDGAALPLRSMEVGRYN